MYLKNGVWVRGTPPKNGSFSRGPKLITHAPQKSAVAPSMARLDTLIQGKSLRYCLTRTLGGLGDIIMATPISRGVKKKYPNAHVTYAVCTKYANGDLAKLLLHIPWIDEIIDYRLINRDEYDIWTDITRAGLRYEKPYTVPQNRIDLFAKSARVPLFGETTPIYAMTEEERVWGKGFVERNIGTGKDYKAKIAIHLRSNDPKRTWPPHRVREFISLCRKEGYWVFLFGWGDPLDQWQLAGCTNVFDYEIRYAAAIMQHCDLLVCPDSSLLHLGGALNMKIVSLFGSIPPASRINHYPNAIAVVNQQLNCLGCIYSSCENNYYCMSSILPQAVLNACQKKLSDKHIEVGSLSPHKIVHTDKSSFKVIKTLEL